MATNLLNPIKLADPIKRVYGNLTGVDFLNEASRVALNRSPDALNVYKDYKTSGECIQTRPGHTQLVKMTDTINGLYFFEHEDDVIVLLHCGKTLYRWDHFPDDTVTNFVSLYGFMNDTKSEFVVFDDILYILDGANYLMYDGTTLQPVSDYVDNDATEQYIPTTHINIPPSGGGESYQPLNVLTTKRKNAFCADGTSTDYHLDTTNIAGVIRVESNGSTLVAGTDYSVNTTTGVVSFTAPPAAPLLPGQDNVFITFSKTEVGYVDRIQKCTMMQVFDNRIFFSGNPDFKSQIFHSKLETPFYVSELDYYQDGLDESPIKSICVGNNILWVFKESNQQKNTIYYHVPTLDSENARIYPSAQGNVSLGCNSASCNFNDDIVFMTDYGLEGVNGQISSEQVLSHRSSLVDSKMVNEEHFNETSFVEWQGYLLCLVNGKIFLADSRQVFQGTRGMEYEWYYWDGFNNGASKLVLLREYKGKLYLGFSDGIVAELDGTNDNDRAIVSYWTTPSDIFGTGNHYKKTNKKGGNVKIKSVPNNKVKIARKTNRTENFRDVTEFSMSGFNFNDVDFSDWNFNATNQNYTVVKIKEKKFIELQIKVYSDEKDKPFGLYEIIIEAYVGGYIKR